MEHRQLDTGIGFTSGLVSFLGFLACVSRIRLALLCGRCEDSKVMIVDMRGNLGSAGAGNLRLMSYMTPEKIPVGYSLTRTRAEQGYKREELAQFTQIPRIKLLAPLTLLKFKDGDKSITIVTEGLGKQPFHGRLSHARE